MNKRRVFTYNDKDVPVGIKLPLTKISNKSINKSKESGYDIDVETKTPGIFSISYSTKEQVFYNLKNLILTQKSERKLNLSFGINWNKYQFNQKNKVIIQQLKEEIQDQCNFWLPFIDVSINIYEENYSLILKLFYKFKNEENFNEQQSISLNIE